MLKPCYNPFKRHLRHFFAFVFRFPFPSIRRPQRLHSLVVIVMPSLLASFAFVLEIQKKVKLFPETARLFERIPAQRSEQTQVVLGDPLVS